MSSLGVQIQITITVDDLTHLDRVRALVADLQRPMQPAAPVSLDAVREAVTTAPTDASGPELAERIRIATGTQANPQPESEPKTEAPRFLREPDPVPVAKAVAKRRGRTWTVTHDELDAMPGHVATLTESERRIIRLCADGLTNQQIADQIFSTPKRVGVRLVLIKKKLTASEPILPKRRGPKPGTRRVIPAPIVNEGSVWCKLCNANRTQHHVEQHQFENQREHDRQAAGRQSIAHLPPDPGTRQTKASA